MQWHRKYLLMIDDAPEDERLVKYFTSFDYQIEQCADFACLNQDIVLPAAFLINCSLIQKQPVLINKLYLRYQVPIIILSQQMNEELCVSMLEAGADDFLIKPINPRELHARISAINRRVQLKLYAEPEKNVLIFGRWRLYPAARQVFDDKNQELQLSAGEYDLLLAFVRRPQQVLNRDDLLQVLKSNKMITVFDRRIDVQISRLRQKLEPNAKKTGLIKTIRNAGYLFTLAVSMATEPVPSL